MEADRDLEVPADEAAGDLEDTPVLDAAVDVESAAEPDQATEDAAVVAISTGEGPVATESTADSAVDAGEDAWENTAAENAVLGSVAADLTSEPEPAAEGRAAENEDEPELPDFVAMIEEATPFATVDDLVHEPDGAVDETPGDVPADGAFAEDQVDDDEVPEPPTDVVLDGVVDVVDASPVPELVAAVPVDEDVEDEREDSVPADSAEVTVEVVDAPPVDEVVEEPADEVSDQRPVDAPAGEDGPAPVTELSGDDLEAAWAEFESGGPGDAAVVDTTGTPVAEETPAADEVVPADMAERLRLARAELEAELDPATLPPEQLAPPSAAVAAAADDPGFADDGVITRKPTETRYFRQSAKLPRIADSEESESDGVASMSRFRARMLRGKKDDD
jgi:hypothetical protein